MFFSVFAVALLAEGVDRNCFWQEGYRQLEEVALLAEEVDRNDDVSVEDAAQMKVALLTEGVDRNSRPGRMQYSQPAACIRS